ncbi:ATPase family AAA domain-containing protein 5b [Brienomyrus brachyistius]|uniref:ATPase family AAA domain-containing protein 5b n=1 Tax=Brienomyrus brachyistius TaxID=42636 RepID=UPI0020B30215|nr:ATPase family AAA domain-containing protein 5b [Brienomyrus brachyistius]
MAGAVAMASVIEDFDTQPCKKQRKDGDTTSVKPITNYFQPMSKTTEKVFSPPKSSSITDYFRKTPPALEKSSMSEQSKENGQKQREATSHTETPTRPAKAQRFRKGRKPGKALAFSKQAQGDCMEVISLSESSCSNMETAPLEEAGMAPALLGSETAALLAQVSMEAFDGEKSPPMESSAATDKHPKKCLQETTRKRPSGKKNLRGSSGCSLESQEECGKMSNGEGGVQSPRSCDVTTEVDNATGLNGGTITISFEDFLQSQIEEDAVSPKDTEKDAQVQSVAASAQGDPQQVSPRTLTIQAEVHPVSNAPELVMNTKKRLASIFTRRQTQEHVKRIVEGSNSPQEKSESLPAPRRKSNVVLREEDLELAVIEPGATTKCSQAERKQFMNAFRQPGQETGKTSKPKKGPSRQETAVERAAEVQEDPPTNVEATNEEEGQTSTSKPLGDEKPGRKGGSRLRRASKKNAEEPPPVPALEEKPSVGTEGKDDRLDPAGDGSNTPAGTTPMRRSTRGRPQQMTPEQKVTMQAPLTRSRERLQRQRLPEKASQGNSSPAVTPKTHRFIRSVYRAEMLSPPDDKGSPIRMRIQRVFMDSEPKSADGSDYEILSPVATKAAAPKTRKQARKLFHKAQALQQNKKTGDVDDKGSVRRSLRNRDLKTTNCEDEDSVVCLEDDEEGEGPVLAAKVEGEKQLRTVNEVLGKAAPIGKEARGCAASKVAPVFLMKKGQKPSAVISVFDDSSREGSENSQDDEQFKARREFLKSGLPESFRKQLARSAASQEAYSAACASFQAVVHVQQKPQDCAIWSLPWPGSALLKHLEMCCLEPPKPILSPGQLGYTKTLPALRAHKDQGPGWREDLSEQVRNCLLEEVRASNPLFPVRRFFTWFHKKRANHLLQCMASDSDESPTAPSIPAPSKAAGKKRKHRVEEEGGEGLSKRRRSSRGQPIVIEDSPPAVSESAGASSELQGRGRLSRAQRQRKDDGKTPAENVPLIVLDTPEPPGNSGKGGCVKEDVLWTEKYQPQHSSEVIGNSAAVKKLHSWLKDWKLRADREEKRNRKERKQEDDSCDSWDSGDFRGEEEPSEEQLCNTLLITGPSGVGKTAAVYACAQELGFKVFEVNASSQRSGRQILSQLKEATQSHQVDIQGTGIFKPSFFNSSSAGSVRCGTSPRKRNSPRKVVSSPRKPPQSPRGAASRRGGLAPTTLADFFKVARPKGKNPDSQAVCPQNARVRVAGKAKEGISSSKPAASKKEPTAEEQSKKTATSLILFEEVDVIFEDDSGFLAAIKTFMSTTKRPVILTTSDPTFSTMFDGQFEEIHFETPSAVNVRTYLQLVCLAENVRTDAGDLSSLLRWTGCDVRQSLLQLQFWVRSGGGHPAPRPFLAPPPESAVPGDSGSAVDKEEPAKNVDPPADLPPCDTSCTESLLGLLNIEPALDLQHLCKCKSSTEPESQRFWEVLSDSWGRGVDLLYSNMEHLLPLPTSTLRSRGPNPPKVPDPAPQEEAGLRRQHPWLDDLSDESPVKVSSSSKRRKVRSGQVAVVSDVDSDDGFLSLCEPSQKAPSNSEETSQSEAAREKAPKYLRAGARAERSPSEQKADELVSSCLDSLAGFLDHMSFLDSALARTELESTFRGGALSWTGAGVKNGLMDEPRMEPVVGVEGRSLAEIRATVEAVSFQQCRAGVERVWTDAQELEQEAREEVFGRLSLPVAPHRQGFSLGHTGSCEPSVAKKRSEVLRAVSSRMFGILGNKPAAAVDYLPMLRTICRSERLKEQGKIKRRFLHYLDGIHLNLPRNTIQHLAEDFP